MGMPHSLLPPAPSSSSSYHSLTHRHLPSLTPRPSPVTCHSLLALHSSLARQRVASPSRSSLLAPPACPGPRIGRPLCLHRRQLASDLRCADTYLLPADSRFEPLPDESLPPPYPILLSPHTRPLATLARTPPHIRSSSRPPVCRFPSTNA